jgi:aspartate racemase
MTPEVTELYYRTINTVVRTNLGGRSAAPLYIYSANLEEMIQYASKKDWSGFASVYKDSIKALSSGSQRIDGIVECAILAHKVMSQLVTDSKVPLLHIADCLSTYVKKTHPHIKRLGLLGPKATMLDCEDPDFFVGRLQSSQHGFEVIIPQGDDDVEEVNRGMLEKVAKGRTCVTEPTKAMFVSQAHRLIERGAQAIVLGSTDLGFVFRRDSLPEDTLVIDPAEIHAKQAAEWILQLE